jgi:hypothetical protein
VGLYLTMFKQISLNRCDFHFHASPELGNGQGRVDWSQRSAPHYALSPGGWRCLSCNGLIFLSASIATP